MTDATTDTTTDTTSDTPTPPATVADVLARLDHLSATLPKRLRQCADQLRGNLDLVAVSTVADMAAAADVAPSAYMRFCQALGFRGYSDMQALFRRDYAQQRPDYAERLGLLRARGQHGSARLLADFVEAGQQSLTALSAHVDLALVAHVVDRLGQADVLHLVGTRRAYPVVSYMGYMLQKMEIPCILHTGTAGVDFTAAIRPADALFAVTFAPYAPETRRIATAAHAAGAPVFLLTDAADCPLAGIATANLIAREVDVGAFRVPTAAMTLVTSIAVALGGARGASD
ncbi:transcriptional regulator, RpiR family [Loktanella fryxellensis]|uniref:Transcriptional regulator, RpiR family n=1 Tax=Loktanella fryxellensis TaxID=245187 RepID=A0A1H8CBH8_9RHOB|nr:MurR/RpiR family transcriptional regulator [Loktanella fryxellensis]SEM91774.1 transcriptional regulator, RpiR family [Loktanella fryxellensis]